MEPTVDKVRQERAFALFLVFKVLAGLWIYQNIFNWDFINLPFAAWLLAMAVTWLAWLFQFRASMRWAYRLEWLGLVVLWGRLLMGLLVPGQGSTKLRTAYEVDLMIRSGVFFLASLFWSHRLKKFAQAWPKPEGARNKKQVALERHQLGLAYLQTGMLLYFLVPLLNNLRFGFNNLDWREASVLNGCLFLGAILATVARHRQTWRLYLGLAGVNLLLFCYPFLYWLMMRGGVGVGPAYWRSLVLYLPFAYLSAQSLCLAKCLGKKALQNKQCG